MKKIWSFLLSVILVFGCTGTLAENMQLRVQFQYDAEQVRQSAVMHDVMEMLPDESLVEPMWQLIESLFTLVEAAEVEMMYGGGNTYMALNLKEKPLITFTINDAQDGSSRKETSLFPGYYFVETAEEAAEQAKEDEKMLRWLEDVEALFGAVGGDLMQVWAENTKPENVVTEEGEYAFGTKVFTHKIWLELDVELFWQVYRKHSPQMFQLMEEALVLSGQETDEQALQQAIDEAQAAPMPDILQEMEMYLERYSAEGALDAAAVRCVWQDKQLEIRLWMEESDIMASLRFDELVQEKDAPLQMETAVAVEATITPRHNGFAVDAMVEVDGQRCWYGLTFELQEEGGFALLYHTFAKKGGAPVGTLSVTGMPFDGEMPKVKTEGKEALPVAALDAQFGEEYYQELQTDMGKGLNSLVIQAVVAAPDEIQAVMNALTTYEDAVYEYYFTEDFQWEEPTEMTQEEGVAF